VIDWVAVTAAATFLLALGTVWLGWQTRAMVGQAHEERRDAFLPLFHWQDPQAGITLPVNPLTLRTHFNIVLWNVGAGAARVVFKQAVTSDGKNYEVAHFVTPSIVPAGEQLTIRVFRDEDITAVLNLPTAQAEATVLVPHELTVTFHYEDVMERRHYETHVTLRAHFEETRGGVLKTPGVNPLPAEPTEQILGNIVTLDFLYSDSRSPTERRLQNCTAETQ
jgi:hypothetical protein